MSFSNKKCQNSPNLNNKDKNNHDKLDLDNKLDQKKDPLKKKSCSSIDIKLINEEKIPKFNNNTSNTYKNVSKCKSNITNQTTKSNNKTNNIPRKKETTEAKKNQKILNKNMKQIKKIGSIESYPSIISTDTLTIKNNNINKSKKNEEQYNFYFNNKDRQYKNESSCNSTIKEDNNNLIQNTENNNNKDKTFMSQKYLSEIATTSEKNENFKNFWKSEQNEIKKRVDRFKYNINQKDIDKIKLDFKFENNPIIKEMDISRNDTDKKEKKNPVNIEPNFIREIKHKNNKQIKRSIPINKNISNNLNYNSNTSRISKNKNKYNFGENNNSNNIINYQTYFRNIENNNYYILSPINSTFKKINSKKNNNKLPKIIGNQRQLEEINEDDIETVKQENTFGCSKIDSLTSETYKDIQIPKYSKYFFEVSEEQNYNHIQGPIEFEYDNSSGRETINNKGEAVNENNCSKLNDINICKLEKKDIGIDDDNINYFDEMKENDDTSSNLNNNNVNNNKFNSISTINEKTISNNCSFNNINLKLNCNESKIDEIKKTEKINKKFSKNGNKKENKIDTKLYKKVKSYQKKIIKDNFDSNKSKPYKSSTKINTNYSEKKQKQILLCRLKKYKVQYIIKMFEKTFKNYKRKIFNQFKTITIKTKQFIIILEKIFLFKSKRKLITYLYKFIDKNKSTDFPLLLPYKNYPDNYNLLHYENNNQENININENTLNNSYNIYYDNNKSNSIRNNFTQNDINKKWKVNTQSSGDKSDSFFYIKKILSPKNTIPFSSKKEQTSRTDSIENKLKNKYKKKLLPKYFQKNNSIKYKNNINFVEKNTCNSNNLNKRIKVEFSERTDDSILNNRKSYKSNNIGEIEDDILEQAYKYKILDEDKMSNGNYHRNIKSELEDYESKKDDLKSYFFKEVEKLEFPDINNIEQNSGQECGEEMSSF